MDRPQTFGDLEQLAVASHPEQAQQAANDDARIKEIRQRRTRGFALKGEESERRIPCRPCQKMRRGCGCIQVLLVVSQRIQVDKRTDSVASDLGGSSSIFLRVGTIISGHATIGLPNARFEKPGACLIEKCAVLRGA